VSTSLESGRLKERTRVLEEAKERLGRIRARTIVLIFLLVPTSVFFSVWNMWVGGGAGALDSLIEMAVAALAVLTGVNALLKQRRPSWALSGGELIAVYLAMTFSIGITSSPWDWGGSIATVITWPIWNAGPENQWQQLIWPNLPTWLTVTNRDALEGFFMGGGQPYTKTVLAAWLDPIVWWSAWVVALFWVTMCLNVIVRRRWSEEEQLPFPMTILPLQMTDPETSLFRNSLWWIGLLGAAAVGLLNLIARLAPAVPSIPMSIDITSYITNNRPWDALRTPYLDWEPWHIGLSYLMPIDLAFSMIVFNLLWRAEYVVSRVLGLTIDPWSGFPYGDQQTIGAYVALMVSVVWLDRRYLGAVLRRAVGLRSPAEDRGEAFSYRTAVLGALVGLACLWYFLQRAGMEPAIVAAFLALYFTMSMAISRIRAHLGPPNNELYGAMPPFALTQYPGSVGLGSRTLGLLALMRPFMGEQRPNPAPFQLEGLRMAERAPIDARRLVLILMAVMPVVMICYFLASLHFGYNLGLGTAKVSRSVIFVAEGASQELDAGLRTPTGPNWGGVKAIGVGFAGSIALMAIKLRFPGWPLHPVAFPLAFCFPIDSMLPAIVIAWAIKTLLLRYGGLRAHRKALPLFLGLLVGSAVMALVGAVTMRILGVQG
jgi:hypothetical protein